MKTIFEYFNDSCDYPDDIVHNPIPYGTIWHYVSDTLLNGFVNYINPVAVFVLDRYVPWEGEKQNLFNEISASKRSNNFPQTVLSCFHDDIVILGKVPVWMDSDEMGRYIFFRYDMDCSDCSIGKFETQDREGDVVKAVINWLELCKDENKGKKVESDIDNGILDYHQLPAGFICGWAKF